MYGIFTYIYHKHQPNVGKYTSPMDPMGTEKIGVHHDLGPKDVVLEATPKGCQIRFLGKNS